MIDSIEQQLIAAGLGKSAAWRKAQAIGRGRAAVGADVWPLVAFHVPGRIEVLGKHTDYAGGRSLLAAAEQGFCIVGRPRADRRVRVLDMGSDQAVEFSLDPELQPAQQTWENYPMTVGRRIARNFPGELRGAEIAFLSDLPPAAGMSSSSALMIACFLVLAELNQLQQRREYQQHIPDKESLAGYLATIENGQSFAALAGDQGVGTFGGSQDHTAILCCSADQLSQYSFCPVRAEQSVRLPAEFCFAIAASGVLAEKTGSAREKYNLISRRAAAIVQVWREQSGRDDTTLAAAVRSHAGALDELRLMLQRHTPRGFSADELIRRLDQFVEESEVIIGGVSGIISSGRIEDIHVFVDLSQSLAEQYLQNQVPQTVALARDARQLGAIAASAFGAGFGGSVWAMVHRDNVEAFLDRWSGAYAAQFPAESRRARFFTTGAGPAALKICLAAR